MTLTLAAEASKNLESVASAPTYWIAAVSAAKEELTTKNTKNTKNTIDNTPFYPPCFSLGSATPIL